FLVEHLVDGDHLAQLHQMLDDLSSLDCHLVRQIGHCNGFRHVNFTRDEFLHLRLATLLLSVTVAATASTLGLGATCAPTVAGRSGRCCCLTCSRLLTAAFFFPTSCFSRLDCALCVRSLCVFLALTGRLVQRAGDAFRFRRLQYLAWPIQHGAQRCSFSLSCLACLFAIVIISASSRACARRSLALRRGSLSCGRTGCSRLGFRRLRALGSGC